MNTTEDRQRTALRDRIARRGIGFRRKDAWERIEEHVGTHRYLLDLRHEAGVDWDEAAISWETTVMDPLVAAVERQRAGEAFPEQEIGDLFIEISDHWYFLKQQKPSASPDEAVTSFTRRFGTRVGRWLMKNVVRRLRHELTEGWERSRQIDNTIREARMNAEEPPNYF